MSQLAVAAGRDHDERVVWMICPSRGRWTSARVALVALIYTMYTASASAKRTPSDCCLHAFNSFWAAGAHSASSRLLLRPTRAAVGRGSQSEGCSPRLVIAVIAHRPRARHWPHTSARKRRPTCHRGAPMKGADTQLAGRRRERTTQRQSEPSPAASRSHRAAGLLLTLNPNGAAESQPLPAPAVAKLYSPVRCRPAHDGQGNWSQ